MEENKKENNIVLSVEEYTNMIKEVEKYKTEIAVLSKQSEPAAKEIEQNLVSPQKKEKRGFFPINE